MGMIGSHFWRNKIHGLKKCDERGREHCSDHADCCAVTACTYCLELEFYDGRIYYGTAEQGGNIWTGSVDGISFEAYWERDYFSNECEFTVIFNGENVYGRGCYDGISCRDSSDEAPVEIGYDSATLRWKRYLSRPLPHRKDPDTGCIKWFCGDCECTVECLCVTITEADGTTVTKDEICVSIYDDGCGPPVWEGTVGDYDLEVQLGYDIYDNCVLLVRVDGIDKDPVPVTGCSDLSASMELYDGTVITFVAKICDCEAAECPCECCPDCWKDIDESVSITIYTEDLPPGGTECSNGTGGLSPSFAFQCGGSAAVGDGYTIVEGVFFIRIFCEESEGWKVQYKSPATGTWGTAPSEWNWVDTGVTVPCPDCSMAVDGVYSTTFGFLADNMCESSGGLTSFQVAVICVIDYSCPE